MLAGKWISKMFEPKNGQNKLFIIQSDRFSYEFTCEMHFQLYGKFIENYFVKICNNVKFNCITSGKVYILYFTRNLKKLV